MKRFLMLILLLAIFDISLLKADTLKTPYQFEVAIMSIFRDEADWLQEWIEYHLSIGVEHFYLYDNCSADDFEEVLSPYIESGIVTLIPWSHIKFPLAQIEAIKEAINNAKGNVKWLALIDRRIHCSSYFR